MENNLRVLMAKAKLNMLGLSKISGVSVGAIRGLFHEKTQNPDSATLCKIAKALNVTIDELLTVEE